MATITEPVGYNVTYLDGPNALFLNFESKGAFQSWVKRMDDIRYAADYMVETYPDLTRFSADRQLLVKSWLTLVNEAVADELVILPSILDCRPQFASLLYHDDKM